MRVLRHGHIYRKFLRNSARRRRKLQYPVVLRATPLLLLILLLFSNEALSQIAGYSFRKKITINNSLVSGTGDLTDFPLLFSITDTDLRTTGNGGDVTDANGYDIVFASADGISKLDHQLEKYTATSGEFVAWVRIPTLDFDDDTEIYIYYGNSSVTTDQSANTTWSGDYEGVWHLSESSTGGTDDFKDESGNARHLTGWLGVASQTPTQSTSGKIGNAQSFDGGDGIIATSYQGIAGTGSRTVSGWVQWTSLPNVVGVIAGYGNSALGEEFKVNAAQSDARIGAVVGGSSSKEGTSTGLNDGNWHYVAVTLNDDGSPSTDEMIIYVDGADNGFSTTDTDAINTVLNANFRIGINLNTGGRWNGLIDEVRLSSVAKSADWIATEYNNQNDPSSFYTVGSEEDPPAPAGLSDDLVLWLAADAGTNSTVNGGSITSWFDKSMEGHDATGTGNAVYQSSFSNFNPAISFTDDDRAISGAISRATGTASTIIVVGNISTVADKGLIEVGTATNRGFFLDQRYAGNTSYSLQTNTPSVWRVDDPGGTTDAVIYENAETIDTQIKTFNTDWTTGNFYLGDDRSGGNRLTGSIAEVIVYDRTLTTAEKLRVEGYLALKYGITLSNADGGLAGTYRASNLFNIWNGDPSYHNDVAGIGRDDASDLEQQKSISINSDAIVLMDKGGSFDSDLAFIVWGNDDGAISLTTTDAHPDYDSRLEREWLADVWGSPGAVSVKIIYPANTGLFENYVLHVDNDGVFASGATNYPATSISGDTVIFDNVTFSADSYFTMGQIIQGPGGVDTNLTLWLKADNRVKNSSAVISSGSVDEWENSISNTSFSEVTLADGDPTLTVDEINYNPTVYLDGVDDRLSNENFDADVLLSDQDNTSFVALIPKNLDATTDVYLGWQSNGSGNRMIYFERNGANSLRTDQFGTNIGGTITVIDDVTIGTAYSDSGGKELSINGEQNGTAAAASFTASGDIGDFNVGTGINGGFDAESYLGEVIHYESALTPAERQRVESYLAIKYGVTLSTDNDGNSTALEAPNGNGINEGDYIASNSTVLWDASANTTYYNDVAGIGRDDASGLSQTKSKSVNSDAVVIMDKGGVFSNNRDFILWGNDNAAITFSATDAHPDYNTRLERVWKVALNGSPGTVTVRVVLTGNTGVAINYALHVDDDGVFSAGSTDYVAADITGDTLTFENIPLVDGQFFTVGQIANGPGGVAGNLQLWLRADNGPTGTPLASWEDQSGTGNDGTAFGTPELTDNAANFNSAIDFVEAETDFFQLADPTLLPTGNDARSYFIVSKATVAGTELTTFAHGTDGAYQRVDLANSTDEIAARFNATNDIMSHSITTANIAMHTYGAAENINPGFDTRQNGFAVTHNYLDPAASSNDLNTGTGVAYVGRNVNGNQEFTGQIMEVIAYDRDLTETAGDAEKVQSYLALKYGITLDDTGGGTAGDYTASNGDVLWDADVNTDYHHDIAGIGWDVISVLDQRKSMSINSDALVVIERNSAFENNRDFILWGNNDAATTLTTTDKHPEYDNRLAREWKVAVNGTPGAVTVKIIYASNTGVITNYALHIDDDGTFGSGTTDYEPTSISGDTLIFENIEFSDGDYFTMGEIVQAPGGIGTNLRLWLRADAGVTGTSLVSAWEDQSGNGHNTSRWGGDPQLVSESINYNAAIDFDGNDSFVTAASNIMDEATGQKYTVFAIVESDDVTTQRAWLGNVNGFSWGLKWYHNTSGQLAASHSFSSNAYQGGNSMVSGKASVATLSYEISGTSNLSRLDGFEYAVATNTAVNYGWGERIQIGGDPSFTGFDGRLVEVIMYEEKLPDSDIARIESYLAIKGGVTLDNTGGGTNGDYTASDGTTILWDADANATYHNDVAGIGKDLTSTLEQQRSISANSDAMVIMDNREPFASNHDFVMWGNDNGGTTITATDAHPNYLGRLEREWKVAVNGSPDTVMIRMIFAGNNGIFGDYVLHVDGDGTFAAGAVNYPATALDGDTLTFPNVILSDGDYFTIGETPRAPGGISADLTLWTKANDGARYLTLPTTTGPLDQWDNAEDNLSLTSLTLADGAPTVSSSQINYNPAIYFDGVDDQLAVENVDGDVLFSNRDNTIFSVMIPKNRDGSTDVYLGWQSDAGSGSGRMAYFQRTGTGLRTDLLTSITSSGSIDVMDQAIVATAHSDVGGISLSVNGEIVSTGATSAFTAGGNQGDLRLGTGAAGSFDAEGYLAELVIYENDLSATNVSKVESYFAIKYGITLGNDNDGDGNTYEAPNEDGIHEGDYLSGDGTTIWDADADTDYNNDVIAIARDDQQALYQRQSRTTDDSLRIFVGDLASDNASNVGFIAPESGFVVIGHNGGTLSAANEEMPVGITSRFGREWKVTNSDFTDEFGLYIKWDSAGTFDINDIRLLVDDNGDFADAAIYANGDNGISISLGSIVVEGISNTIIPANSTRYITIGSASLGTTLPIELIDFQAVADQDKRLVRLQWTTATETNNEVFTIEKSVDSQDWEEALSVPGAGNSTQRIDYQAIDEKPYPGLSYYRLKQTDFDGEHTYSNPLHVALGDFSDGLILYPNPAETTLVITGDPQELLQVRIINSLGQEVSNKVRVVERQNGRLTLDISLLPPGIFIVKSADHSVTLVKSQK